VTTQVPLAAERWQRLTALFDELADLPAAERSRRLAELERDDPELAAALSRLLAADAHGAGFLEEPIQLEDPGPLEEFFAEPPPERAGPFRIVRLLGRGGMAEVYAAERVDGSFTQSVAVKVIRRGLDTEDMLARFVRERRILAGLEHTAIARLIDGGALPDGRPFVVMERVEGVPITDYAEEHHLGVEERLRLLVVACDAVAYAHANLVVHRDLKPSNVLVSKAGEVKLLDFGIAKLIAPEGEPAQTQTARELRMLTPAYAAPEQFAGEPTTTATDVWGLGALGYELLTGMTPLPGRDTSSGSGIIPPSVPPARMSTRILAHGAFDPELKRRALRLRGDVDTIIAKALALDPARRYPSAEALAADLRRHLEGRPVQARPDSLRYRVGKFVGRHRVGVAAATLAALALIAGATIATWQARVARRERDVADRARVRNEKLVDFMLGDLTDKLSPSSRLDIVTDLGNAVLRSLDAIPPAERNAVTTAQRARVLVNLSSIQQLQGDPVQAEVKVREAIALLKPLAGGPRPPPDAALDLAGAHSELVRALADQGKSAEAMAAARVAVEQWRALVARNPREDERRVGLAHALNEAGRIYLEDGNNLDARRFHLEAIALFDALPAPLQKRHDVAIARLNAYQYAGRTYELAGEFEAATEKLRVATAQATALSQADPTDLIARHQVSVVTNDMGRVLRRSGKLDEAEAAFRRALEITEYVVAKDPGNLFFRSDLSACHSFIGRVKEMQGKLEEALAEFQADATISAELVAKEPDNGSWRGFLADALTNVGRAQMKLGRLSEALTTHEKALALREKALQADREDAAAQADTGESLLERGRVREKQGDAAAARADWTRAAELLVSALKSSDYVNYRLRYARTLLELGDVVRARPVVERLLKERSNDPDLLALCRRHGLLP